jgi:hypothetical protein
LQPRRQQPAQRPPGRACSIPWRLTLRPDRIVLEPTDAAVELMSLLPSPVCRAGSIPGRTLARTNQATVKAAELMLLQLHIWTDGTVGADPQKGNDHCSYGTLRPVAALRALHTCATTAELALRTTDCTGVLELPVENMHLHVTQDIHQVWGRRSRQVLIYVCCHGLKERQGLHCSALQLPHITHHP